MHHSTSGGGFVVIYTLLLNVVTKSGSVPVENRSELVLQSLMVGKYRGAIDELKLLIADSGKSFFTY